MRTKKERTSIRLTPELLATLKAASIKHGLSYSLIAKKAIYAYKKHNPNLYSFRSKSTYKGLPIRFILPPGTLEEIDHDLFRIILEWYILINEPLPEIHNTCLHSMNYIYIPTCKIAFRRTPEGQKTVPEIVKPGMKIRTSYSKTIYEVVEVTGPYSDDPNGHTYPPSYGVTISYGKHKPRGWINEVVAVDGRLLFLFEDCKDEIFVIEEK